MAKWTNENKWDDAIRVASSRFGVPMALIKAIIAHESGFKPDAYRAEPKIKDGSHGLMQILLATARGEGYTGESGNRYQLSGLFDPYANIVYGTMYLASMLQRAGDLSGAISAYNGGYRPDLGFGEKATRQVRVCLARDTTSGECIRWQDVMPGQYANQSYVNSVLNHMAYFEQQLHTTPTVIPTTPPLSRADSIPAIESQAARRNCRPVDRPVGTHATTANVVTRILEWLLKKLRLLPR